MLCQMSKYFGKCFGPSTQATGSSFWLSCPSFLLSKFTSQLKLIQSVVLAGILGICVTSWILRILCLRVTIPKSQGPISRGLGVRVPCPTVPRSQASGSRVSESQGPGSQGPGLQVPESHGTGTQTPGVAGLRSQGPRSRVLGPDFRLCSFMFHINLINMEHKREHTSIKCKTFGKLLPSNQDHVWYIT